MLLSLRISNKTIPMWHSRLGCADRRGRLSHISCPEGSFVRISKRERSLLGTMMAT
jgi:hypothetical protein